ncbi:MAG: hypothetical protein NPMRTH1_760021 [Nitrosopumilales archaeon]|nr:MAG: hypothetical protein NPMRTH1_760021 [Nitrosopumilales archaeon]
MKKWIIFVPIIVILVLFGIAIYQIQTYEQIIIPDNVKNTLQQNIEDGFYEGIIIGTVDQYNTEFFALGNISSESIMPIDKNTKFEIASISKLFTATLLADLVSTSRVNISDSITKFLPSNTNISEENENITLEQLVTHTSGLPRLPENQTNTWREFYSTYDSVQLIQSLSMHSSNSSKYSYSNFGYTLLGYALENVFDQSLQNEVDVKILNEFGMSNTTITNIDDKSENFALGHKNGEPTKDIQWKAPLGAGGYHSTANDLVTFLSVNLGIDEPTPEFVKLTHQPYYNVTNEFAEHQSQSGLGWKISTCPGTKVLWHDGGTDGYRAFLGFEPNKKWGVVVLTNSETEVEHIGLHLLHNSTFDMREFNLDKTYLDYNEVLGTYQMHNYTIKIEKTGNQFFAKINEQPKKKIYPESDTKFFFTDEYSFLEFERNEMGVIKGINFHKFDHEYELTFQYCSRTSWEPGTKIS